MSQAVFVETAIKYFWFFFLAQSMHMNSPDALKFRKGRRPEWKIQYMLAYHDKLLLGGNCH